MVYLISYDLNGQKDYSPFYKALAHLGAHKVLMSRWILKHPKDDIEALRDYLWKLMDEKDRLLITSLDNSKFTYKNLLTDIDFIME